MAACTIYGQPGRFVATGELPALHGSPTRRIDHSDLGRIFHIDIDPSLVRRSVFEFSAEWDGRYHLHFARIDGHQFFAAAVHHDHSFAELVIEDRIGILTDLDLADYFQRARIECRNGAGLPIAKEAAVELGNKSDSVRSVCGHRAYLLAAFGVNHENLVVVRNEQTLSHAIVRNVIPAALSSDDELVHQFKP